jgi:hypothetical protein
MAKAKPVEGAQVACVSCRRSAFSCFIAGTVPTAWIV